METIGERVRKRRKDLKLKVPDLARATGLANSTIYDLENGGQKETTKLHLLAKILRCSVDWLETGKGPVETQEGQANDRITVYGYSLTEDAARLAAEWEKLEEPMRSQISTMIESLVAKQIRDARSKKKSTKDGENHADRN
jgi:transcriptional regulator with XRE-family HTH domain